MKRLKDIIISKSEAIKRKANIMRRLKIPEEPIYRGYKNNLKRWTIYDRRTNNIFDITDERFAEGLKNNAIELRSQFIEQNGHKIWIDGIVKR